MAPIQYLLYTVPTSILGSIIIAGTVVFVVAGLFIVRAFVPTHKIKLHNDIAGYIFTTLGVIYAVLLAFMVVVSWQSFDNSNSNVTREANSIAALYRDMGGLSPAFRVKAQPALDSYVNSIINDEWPLLQKGQRSMVTQQKSNELWDIYYSYEPVTESQKVFFAESVSKKNMASELRRQRILDSRTGIHPILWLVLIAGGIITITFTFFFGTENFAAQIIMSSLLAALIALILFTIMNLDYPFTGDISIRADAFREILRHLSSAI